MLITWFQSKLKCQKKINLTLKMNLDIYFGWFGWEKRNYSIWLNEIKTYANEKI